MSSDNTEPVHPSMERRVYLLMRADTNTALRLVRERLEQKSVPSYVRVSNLSKSRIAEFVDLYNRCFVASPDPFCPLTVEDAKTLDTDGIFIAELWGTPVGFIACFVEKEESSVYGEITGLGVLPSRRRRGVATALIQRAAEYFSAAGVEQVYCEVYENNMPSRLLIASYGFEEVGRREISVPIHPEVQTRPENKLPGGKIMRRLYPSHRTECRDCRDI